MIPRSLTERMQRATQALKTVGSKVVDLATAKPVFSWWSMIFVIVLFIVVLIIRGKYATTFETPENIRSRVLGSDIEAIKAHYSTLEPNRKSLTDYLKSLQAPKSHRILANFQFSTVNGAGLFFPGTDGIFSVDAVRTAVSAGARAFVLDVWPDLGPRAEFAPILQVISGDSTWQRLSMNTLSFATALNTLVQAVYANTLTGGARAVGFDQDVVVLYLRLQGTPRKQTFDGIARALRANIEPYRLDVSFNACAGQTDNNRLFITPIEEFRGKVIVACNKTAAGTSLEDYVNCVATEYASKDLQNLTQQGREKTAKDIQLSAAFIAPPLDSDMAAKNAWAFQQGGLDFGIQFAAMNFGDYDSDTMKTYMSESMFGTYSYRLKPEGLRYIPLTLADPKAPKNPKWGEGAKAGAITVPDSISLAM